MLEQNCRIALAALLYHLDHFAQAAAQDKKALFDLLPWQIDEYLADESQQQISTLLAEKKDKNSDVLLNLLSQVDIGEINQVGGQYYQPLLPLSVQALFPLSKKPSQKEIKTAYQALWQGLQKGIKMIPKAYQTNPALWLDHFESLWQIYTHAIPFSDAVSLYDHARIQAALAVAHQQSDDQDQPFLLIQGDFFGIQSFIFASGAQTNQKAAKLLRGRSFYVSLLTECAALKVLDELELPPTSQVINAAGKFQIIAPNRSDTLSKLKQVQAELDQWFMDKSWGQSGIGLAWQAAAFEDFKPENTQALIKRLFQQLEKTKFQRFQLCQSKLPAVFEDYLKQIDDRGLCQIDGRSPARYELEAGIFIGELAQDQIQCGQHLTHHSRILLTHRPIDKKRSLKISLFGYYISFMPDESIKGRFTTLIKDQSLCRIWDYDLPQTKGQVLWQGYARRTINAYVPIVAEKEGMDGRYDHLRADQRSKPGEIKTLHQMACDDLRLDPDSFIGNQRLRWIGQEALTVLKGDIDNLGLIFQRGLPNLNFTKVAALSRQINAFFALYLPWQCADDHSFRNIYTVFAGGDDFFLIGPWRSTMELAKVMRQRFQDYSGHNPQLHFSVGLSMIKPGLPITWLAQHTEEQLEHAKKYNNEQKNAICCFNETVSWSDYDRLSERAQRLDELRSELELSTGYLYDLLQLVDMKQKVDQDPRQALWRSYFAYRTWRLLDNEIQRRYKGLSLADRLDKIRSWVNKLAIEIADQGIDQFGSAYRIALFTHLYQHRRGEKR